MREKEEILEKIQRMINHYPTWVIASKQNGVLSIEPATNVIGVGAKEPPILVKPVIKGKWMEDISGYKCSVCNYVVQPWNTTNFCPRCGADMREE